MIKNRGDIVQSIMVSKGFGQAKNSTYMVREQDVMFEVDKDAEVEIVHPNIVGTLIFTASKYKVYSLPPETTSIKCNQKFNVGA